MTKRHYSFPAIRILSLSLLLANMLVMNSVGCKCPAVQEIKPATDQGPAADRIPNKTIVLTFDDSVKSQFTFVGPLLKKYGFGATFFVTNCWAKDTKNFMTWEEVAKLYKMGFEIGNHTWTHGSFNTPQSSEKLPEELAHIERALEKVGVPRPVSFAWPGNGFGPESLSVLRKAGYKYARRGMQPELPYGEIHIGPLYDPMRHDPLLIPTTGDAYPKWTLEHFKKLVNHTKKGCITILQFHGVPDIAHPWVNTPPEQFRKYMDYLKKGGFNVIALRDIGNYIPAKLIPVDPMAKKRYP